MGFEGYNLVIYVGLDWWLKFKVIYEMFEIICVGVIGDFVFGVGCIIVMCVFGVG